MSNKSRVLKLEQSIGKDREIIVLRPDVHPELKDDDVMEAKKAEWVKKFPAKEVVFIILERKDRSMGKKVNLDIEG